MCPLAGSCQAPPNCPAVYRPCNAQRGTAGAPSGSGRCSARCARGLTAATHPAAAGRTPPRCGCWQAQRHPGASSTVCRWHWVCPRLGAARRRPSGPRAATPCRPPAPPPPPPCPQPRRPPPPPPPQLPPPCPPPCRTPLARPARSQQQSGPLAATEERVLRRPSLSFNEASGVQSAHALQCMHSGRVRAARLASPPTRRAVLCRGQDRMCTAADAVWVDACCCGCTHGWKRAWRGCGGWPTCAVGPNPSISLAGLTVNGNTMPAESKNMSAHVLRKVAGTVVGSKGWSHSLHSCDVHLRNGTRRQQGGAHMTRPGPCSRTLRAR